MAQRVILVQDAVVNRDGFGQNGLTDLYIATQPVGSFEANSLQMRLRPYVYEQVEGVWQKGAQLKDIDGIYTVDLNVEPASPETAFDNTFGDIYGLTIAELIARQPQWAGKCTYIFI